MTNEQLATRIKSGDNTADNMAQLWQQNRGFIAQVARKYNGLGEEEDLLQEGYIGLCRAVDNYDPSAGSNFLGYAGYWIHQAMRRYVDNNGTVRLPVYRRADILKYRKAVSTFKKDYGRQPEIGELMDILYLPYKDVLALKKDAELLRIASIDTPVGDDDGHTLGELLPGCDGIEEDVIEKADLESLRGILWPMVDALPGNQPAVIRARFKDGLTLKETGNRIGISLNMVNQEKDRAMRELRRPSNAKLLRPYFRDYISTHAYKGNGVGTFNRTWTSSTERTALKLLE